MWGDLSSPTEGTYEMTYTDKQAWESVMYELVELGIMEIVNQSSDLDPGFRFTKTHMEKIVSNDKEYIRYLKEKHDIDTTNEHINNFKIALENFDERKKLN